MAGSITTATLVARLIADTSQFAAGMRSADATLMTSTQRFTAMGRTAGDLSKKMMGPAMAVAAIGGLAVRSAMKYEEGLTKIATLTTATTADVEAFSAAMMRVGSETGIAPVKLTDAMFMLASSGLSASSAMDALEMSAQASAMGLGDAGTIADAVSSAINAYGESNLSARDATNALINAVKMGKMKPEELAGSLGKVIPMAKAMGVSFQEVVGDMASLTQIGLSSALASTALRATLMAIVHPTKDASAALAIMSSKNREIPATFAGIQASIKDKGLVPTLQGISDAVNGNATAMTSLFPEARALSGVLAWTGGNAENSAKNFEALKKNTDMLSKGMDYLAKQPGFQMKRSLTELQISLQKFGDAILPAVSKMMSGYAQIAKAFGDLPKPILFAIGAAGTFFVSLALLLFIFGKIAAVIDTVTAAITAMTAAEITAESVNPFLAVAAAVAILAATMWSLTRSAGPPKDLVEAMTKSLETNKTVIDDTTVAMMRQRLAHAHQLDDLKRLETRLDAGVHGFALWTAAIGGNVTAQRQLRRAMLESGEVELRRAGGQRTSLAQQEAWIRTGKVITDGAVLQRTAISGNIGLWKQFETGIQSNAAAHQTLREKLWQTTDGMTAFQTAQAGARANGETLVRTLDDMKADLEATDAAAQDAKTSLDWLFGASTSLVEAQVKAARSRAEMIKTLTDGTASTLDDTDAVVANFTALQDLASQQARNNVPLTEWKNGLAMGSAELIKPAIASGASVDTLKALAAAMSLPKDVQTQIGLPGIDNASLMVNALLDKLKEIDQTDPTSTVTIDGDSSGAVGALGRLKGALENTDLTWQGIMGHGFVGPTLPLTPQQEAEAAFRKALANALAQGMPNGHAAGGVFTQRHVGIVGEAGPEAIVPLGSSPDAQKNRAHVLEAIGASAGAAMISGGGGSTVSNTFEVTVNVPPTADPSRVGQSVVDALVAWSRRNGSIPVKTTG